MFDEEGPQEPPLTTKSERTVKAYDVCTVLYTGTVTVTLFHPHL